MHSLRRTHHQSSTLSVELAPLNVDAVFSNSHAQILHRENRPTLSTAGSTASVSSPWSTERRVLSSIFLSLASGFALSSAATGTHAESSGTSKASERVVRCGVGTPDARVLVRVRCDVRDELLRREREEPRQAAVCLRRRREAGQREVVICDGIGDERSVVVHLAEELAQAGVFLLRDARLDDSLWVGCFGAQLRRREGG